MSKNIPNRKLNQVPLKLFLGIVLLATGCKGGAELSGVAVFENDMTALGVEQTTIDCMVRLGGVNIEAAVVSETDIDELKKSCEFSQKATSELREEQAKESASEELVDVALNYGDDTVLDALWDQCGDGNGGACDSLFEAAPVGSAYEAFGVSCGETPGVLNCGELGQQPSELVPSVYVEMMATVEAKAAAAKETTAS